VELFVEYYLRDFRKYLICVQNILQTNESTICMIFGLNKNTIQCNTKHTWATVIHTGK
jgi:hypothetical protein